MKKRIFITATNTNIGKTYTTKLLFREFVKQGFKVGAIKAIESGVKADLALDGLELLKLNVALNPALAHLSLADVVPFTYALPAAPFVASGGKDIDIDKILSAIKELEKDCDIVLIEGAGGLFVPINRDFFMIDLIKKLDAKALLVTHCLLGCINDTLLNIEALKSKNIEHVCAFNCIDESDFEIVSKPYFDATNFEVLKTKRDIVKISKLLYN